MASNSNANDFTDIPSSQSKTNKRKQKAKKQSVEEDIPSSSQSKPQPENQLNRIFLMLKICTETEATEVLLLLTMTNSRRIKICISYTTSVGSRHMATTTRNTFTVFCNLPPPPGKLFAIHRKSTNYYTMFQNPDRQLRLPRWAQISTAMI
uniref:Uncharacterized protein n=1 Tax=Clytia hemisphaerica TaxID=252671 RepID=A0A7M6DR43_9CNID